VSSFQFPVSSFQFPVSSFQFPVSSFQFPVSSFQFPVSSFQFPVSSYSLNFHYFSTTNNLLASLMPAGFLLPDDYHRPLTNTTKWTHSFDEKRALRCFSRHIVLFPKLRLGNPGGRSSSFAKLEDRVSKTESPGWRSHRYTHLAVGRNKPVRALAQDRRFRHSEAQKRRKRPPWLSPGGLIPAYVLS
ncbi:MAG: hypothetical protein QX199_13630, partial [Methylococcaceae bacterium]